MLIETMLAQAEPPAAGVIEEWFETTVWGNAAWKWGVAIGVALVVYVVLAVARRLVKAWLGARASKTKTRLDDLVVAIVSDVRGWCMGATAVYLGGTAVTLPRMGSQGLKLLLVVAVALQVLVTSRIVVDVAIAMAVARGKDNGGEQDRAIASASGIIRFIVMLVLGALLLLLALSNMGVQVTPLLTGLGIGGIAVALAAQSILGDLFGSLSIVFDKPFLVGDVIAVGPQMGTVEHIGVKTTRVRSVSGEQLVFRNSDLLSSRIQNFKRMNERRVVGTVGIVYETPIEKVEAAPGMIRSCIESAGGDRVRIDRVHLRQLAAFSLEFEYVYFVLTPDMNVHMEIQQAVNLEILRRLAASKVSIAYPTAVQIQR
ncbi:MAG: mechanosensitive ion channel family protein [Phycisphaerales bacterium]|nr:mechanosensitive ion channel family protein [Phycisphaerales bacterium]